MLLDKKIDMIFVSPFLRTKETADAVAEIISFPKENIKTDTRLMELSDGVFIGKSITEMHKFFEENNLSKYDGKAEGGESLIDVKKRTGEFIYNLETEYQNKNILIITHEDTAWALFSTVKGLNKERTMAETDVHNDFLLLNGEIRELDFTPIAHNENYELDLHRPYIDTVKLECDCGGALVRTPEVMDVWFDSGAMPYAQDHYPFENKDWVDGAGYPADFISEAIDQTRGWFYTLHAVGVLMGRGKAYKNVICLGHLLDANGKKMSKSLGNVVDPWMMMDKYGVDTLRLWMYSVNQPGESKNFDEKTVALLYSQVFGLLYNVLAFYELYRDKNLEDNEKPNSQNILDVWILSKFDELVYDTTGHMDNYKLLEPVRAIRGFVGDLSTWYLRRSRERIKEGDTDAKKTLYYVLKNLIKVMAPFAPFASEDMWGILRSDNDVESVHLTEWPKGDTVDAKMLEEMDFVRTLCTEGNAERQKLKIPVRQPLNSLTIRAHPLTPEYEDILKDELNVKNILHKNVFISSLEHKTIEFDSEITPELKEEGNYRELVRALQDMRKKIGLTPSEAIAITFETSTEGQNLIKKFEEDMKKTVLVSKIEFTENGGEEIKVDSLVFKVKIDKI